jgi:putative two-component system response regulator
MDKKEMILVVDDEERNLRLMEAILLPLGYGIVFARNGEEALACVRDNPVDLVLLDIMMPRMDGFEVARRLKADVKTMVIPIVVVTALNDVGDRVKALEAGADDFLSKPVEKNRGTGAGQIPPEGKGLQRLHAQLPAGARGSCRPANPGFAKGF